MEVGAYIKLLRIQKGLSQEELGEIIGVQRAAVQKWESGVTKNLKRDTIKNLALFFGVSPTLFVDPTPNESTSQENNPCGSEFVSQNSDFYRTLLSGQGIKIIRKELFSRINAYGFEKFQTELGVSYRNLKEFLSADISIGSECQAQLEKMLVILETDLYELFKDNFVNDEIKSYYDLDDIDRAEVRGEIKNMLKADKYKKYQKETSPSPFQSSRVRTTADLEDHTERIAAFGGMENNDDEPLMT